MEVLTKWVREARRWVRRCCFDEEEEHEEEEEDHVEPKEEEGRVKTEAYCARKSTSSASLPPVEVGDNYVENNSS